MTPLDDLFSTDESRAEAQLEKVVTLNPADISDFPNHPFKVKQDEAMAEMVDSVKLYGVLAPALVRPKADGGYEMVAGHEGFGRDIRYEEGGVFGDNGYVRSNGSRFVDIYDGDIENIPEEYRISSPAVPVRSAAPRQTEQPER